jgi:hypothetical protein
LALIPSRHALLACLSLALLTACGGGGESSTSTPAPVPVVVEKPATRNEAARFLTQATFGPVDADIDRVMAVGYAAWIDEQLALPATNVHRTHWQARDQELRAADPNARASGDHVLESFWKQAVTGPDPLRQRVAYALSQIFVISMADSGVADNPRAVAAWLDMLGNQGLGRYRDLLETVSLHPMMGVYLSHLRNQKADARTGRVPDENFAREVMQLFSIGLVELNPDGSARLVAARRWTPTRRPTSAAWRRSSRAGAGPARTGRTTTASSAAAWTALLTPTAVLWPCRAIRSTTARTKSASSAPPCRRRPRPSRRPACVWRWTRWPRTPTWGPSSVAS